MLRAMGISAAVLLAACTTAGGAQTQTASIVGNWHQDQAACAGAPPVLELIFAANGAYSVTWLPFETYKDYWGHYRYDAHTGALTLTVDGGNHIPTDMVRTGHAHVAAHDLTFDGLSLGSPSSGAICAAPFHRG